jgi:PAT family beta-lactamase induction signal transducer AmpG
MSDDAIATLTLVSTLVSAAGCIAGGWLSDRFGRRRMLALYLVGTALPTAGLAWLMWKQGWIWPIDPRMPGRPVPPDILITGLWAACLVYAVFQGLMTGTRTALYMDICTPEVAATQFTAYMAMINLVTWYTARWQGVFIEAMGYPVTLLVDAGFGLFGICLLPAMVPLAAAKKTSGAGAAAPPAGTDGGPAPDAPAPGA